MLFDQLSDISNDLLLEAGQFSFVRSALFNRLEPPKQNVVILKGARGIGKSTIIQQFLHKKQVEGARVLYISADSTLLESTLAEFAYEYQKRGGVYLAFDEIHKYPDWQSEIKTILDSFTQIKLLVSGSSSMHLDYASSDLSRRHIMLAAKGLSFREYMEMHFQLKSDVFNLEDLLVNADKIASDFVNRCRKNQIDLLAAFKLYLKEGYFLSKENYDKITLYYDSLINTMNSVIESDLPYAYQDIDNMSKKNIKNLLKHIAKKCPFTPNISELSNSLGVANKNTLKKYLYYLNKGDVLINLYAMNKSHKDFQKPEKIFLSNTNYAYAFEKNPLMGTIRETFVACCLQDLVDLTAPTSGDFLINNEIVFEVGGRSKNNRQVKSVKKNYVLADDIFTVSYNQIPLWLLGFLW